MRINRSASSLVVAASVALAALSMTGAAQAQNVYWSVGLSSPGVQLGVSSALPIIVGQRRYQPTYWPTYEPVYQPVYETEYESAYEPVYQRVYRAPRPVVYVRPAPYFVGSTQYIRADWRYPGHDRGWNHGQRRYQNERFAQGRSEGERAGHNHPEHRRD